eukprot:scaffold102601_cov60-Phaeocystis_antarctica.AAC.1
MARAALAPSRTARRHRRRKGLRPHRPARTAGRPPTHCSPAAAHSILAGEARSCVARSCVVLFSGGGVEGANGADRVWLACGPTPEVARPQFEPVDGAGGRRRESEEPHADRARRS